MMQDDAYPGDSQEKANAIWCLPASTSIAINLRHQEV
jgi:hypothetical protein